MSLSPGRGLDACARRVRRHAPKGRRSGPSPSKYPPGRTSALPGRRTSPHVARRRCRSSCGPGARSALTRVAASPRERARGALAGCRIRPAASTPATSAIAAKEDTGLAPHNAAPSRAWRCAPLATSASLVKDKPTPGVANQIPDRSCFPAGACFRIADGGVDGRRGLCMSWLRQRQSAKDRCGLSAQLTGCSSLRGCRAGTSSVGGLSAMPGERHLAGKVPLLSGSGIGRLRGC
jgi:hypothetical protein